MAEKIFPRNLTARAAAVIAGNPVNTRLESGVGNCFPGLEFDVRNLDRRFFPGLVFNFGTLPVVLYAIERDDPALEPQPGDDEATRRAIPALSSAVRRAFDRLGAAGGHWELVRLAQGGRKIDTVSQEVFDGDGGNVWRLVRSLERDQVTITLKWAADGTTARARKATAETIELTHYRRRFIDPDRGTISPVYRPGELTQSLCSPWQHDFRDCSCNYWASNHPDIVLAEDPLGTGELPSGASADPQLATQPLDWLRADRSSRVIASPVDGENDQRRLRHYQINQEWAGLAFVLEGKEISAVYAPRDETFAKPFDTADDLVQELASLCQLEHVVALEYLYAYFSLREPDERGMARKLSDDLLYARHEILGVAISEMRHLRWANQLIWSLEQRGMVKNRVGPELRPAENVPGPNGSRPRALRPLTPEVLADFIAIERPSGTLDGAYARVISTLRSGYPEVLLQLARQIAADGMDHYSRFCEIQLILKPYDAKAGKSPPPYLRPIKPASSEEAKTAIDLYTGILGDLEAAYKLGDMEEASSILDARKKMTELETAANALASKGLGVPFF